MLFYVIVLLGVKVLEPDGYPDHNKGPDRPQHIALVLGPIPFIDPHLFEIKAFPPTCTSNVANLKVQLLTYLAMTKLGSIIEPISFPTPSGCATCCVMDSGYK